jgi:1-deoxy-D-xylulose-5-phosphate reductoisomerase
MHGRDGAFNMKKVFLAGSTGSIGQSTLEVVDFHRDSFKIVALVTNRNIELLSQQVMTFAPDYAVIYDYEAYKKYKGNHPPGHTRIGYGEEGLVESLQSSAPDIFVNAFVGFAGLQPTLHAIGAGITVALANKETLVVAGKLIEKIAGQKRVMVLPIDSEHSAIWQCLQGEENNPVLRIILTASGGPFRNMDQELLETVSPEQALRHPNWKMGAKITIDSATLMNKGLEVIEAHWLYKVPPGRIEVVIHPQSVIHSMVEFEDHSVKAQLGIPDMKIPIQYALSYPRRLPMKELQMDFYRQPALTFERPDYTKFPCLTLAYKALEQGLTYPAALNAANEVAVAAFLNREIGFNDIARVIESVLSTHKPVEITALGDCLEADRQARVSARSVIIRKQNKRN